MLYEPTEECQKDWEHSSELSDWNGTYEGPYATVRDLNKVSVLITILGPRKF